MTEQAKHSPTPWQFETVSTADDCGYILDATGEYVADVNRRQHEDYNKPDTEGRANGTILAAAPDLLAACRMALDRAMLPKDEYDRRYPAGNYNTGNYIMILAAAIAKAEGK